jgi:hypothetical protein
MSLQSTLHKEVEIDNMPIGEIIHTGNRWRINAFFPRQTTRTCYADCDKAEQQLIDDFEVFKRRITRNGEKPPHRFLIHHRKMVPVLCNTFIYESDYVIGVIVYDLELNKFSTDGINFIPMQK